MIRNYEVQEIGEYSRLEKLRSAQTIVGGKFVLVEREADRPKLLEFYKEEASSRGMNVMTKVTA